LCLDPDAVLRNGDSVVFFNFRSDRAREITARLTGKKEKAPVRLSQFACMREYQADFGLPVAFTSQSTQNNFPEVLERQGLKQFRIAETEKYAHVTFFFNGGREEAFQGEDRVLVPSPKDVATYDLKPEMSAFAVADAAAERIVA